MCTVAIHTTTLCMAFPLCNYTAYYFLQLAHNFIIGHSQTLVWLPLPQNVWIWHVFSSGRQSPTHFVQPLFLVQPVRTSILIRPFLDCIVWWKQQDIHTIRPQLFPVQYLHLIFASLPPHMDSLLLCMTTLPSHTPSLAPRTTTICFNLYCTTPSFHTKISCLVHMAIIGCSYAIIFYLFHMVPSRPFHTA